jgi:hypothetical protein
MAHRSNACIRTCSTGESTRLRDVPCDETDDRGGGVPDGSPSLRPRNTTFVGGNVTAIKVFCLQDGYAAIVRRHCMMSLEWARRIALRRAEDSPTLLRVTRMCSFPKKRPVAAARLHDGC